MKLPYKDMMIGEEPEIIQNPYSGVKIELNPIEVAVYDTIKGLEMFGKYKQMQKGIDWFIKNNVKAYMALLD
jgi:hypothetical protein